LMSIKIDTRGEKLMVLLHRDKGNRIRVNSNMD